MHCELACNAVEVLSALSVRSMTMFKKEGFPSLMECIGDLLDAFCGEHHLYDRELVRRVEANSALSPDELSRFRRWAKEEDWRRTPYPLFAAVSRLLIRWIFDYRAVIRTFSAVFYLLIRRLIRITFYHITRSKDEGMWRCTISLELQIWSECRL